MDITCCDKIFHDYSCFHGHNGLVEILIIIISCATHCLLGFNDILLGVRGGLVIFFVML